MTEPSKAQVCHHQISFSLASSSWEGVQYLNLRFKAPKSCITMAIPYRITALSHSVLNGFFKKNLQKFTSTKDVKSSLNMCYQNCSPNHLYACIFKTSILQFIQWNRENFRFSSNFLPWLSREWRIMLSREPFKTTALFPQQLPFTYSLRRMDAIGCLSAKNNLLCFHPFSSHHLYPHW